MNTVIARARTATVIARACSARSNPAGSLRPAAGLLWGLRPLALTVLASGLLTACGSPEATRTRGGGPGADVKNWNQPVEFHAGAEIYYETPCAMEPVECNGPPPVFGPTPPPD
jgi:hypothetical protein